MRTCVAAKPGARASASSVRRTGNQGASEALSSQPSRCGALDARLGRHVQVLHRGQDVRPERRAVAERVWFGGSGTAACLPACLATPPNSFVPYARIELVSFANRGMVWSSDVRFFPAPMDARALIAAYEPISHGHERHEEEREESIVNKPRETLPPTASGVAEAPASPQVSVVIPALNEACNLPFVLAHLPIDLFELILVDGHSNDNTVGVGRRFRPDIRLVYQVGHGKANALQCASAAARADAIVSLD